jgi:predicted RND superfamily exporter protein
MLDYEAVVERLSTLVVDRPGTVVVAFLLVTVAFGAGLGSVSTEAGTDQFTQDVPAQNAFEAVNREFSPTFQPDTGSTQLIQRGRNVLSKPELLAMLRAQERISDHDSLRVAGTSSAARIVARQLDPNATTLEAQIRAVERATPTQIDAAVRRAADNPQFTGTLSDDFSRESASASATIATVTHELPGGLSSGAGQGGSSPLTDIQLRVDSVVETVDSDITVFGSGIISDEFSNVIGDSLVLVVPAAVVLILTFLVFAYRDPIDLVLGTASLAMAIVWTFGFMGLAGIPFTQMLIAVPPLLLAVGIDFGIHTVNRYREELVAGREPAIAMDVAARQLLVAFFIVTGTTVLGFGSNVTSSLGPIRDFGVIAAIGIVFTFLVFGVFLPAAKMLADDARERYGVPTFSTTPLGREDSVLGRVLPVGVGIARRAPVVFVLLVLVATAGMSYYGAGVDTSFSQEDFLPPSDTPEYLDGLPEPFKPGDYTVTATLDYLEANFESAQQDSVTVYVEGPLRRDSTLESVQHASRNPSDSFVADGRSADPRSVIDVIDAYAAANPEFAALVARSDADGDGVPDDNLDEIYDSLLDSPYRDRALNYISEDRRSMRVVYSTKSDATDAEVAADGRAVAERYRHHAVATGTTVVFQAVADTIFTSAIRSLATALAATAAFLVFVYWLLERRPSLGIVNLVPILVTVALIAASMRFFGVPFNALTATVLAIAIGLGIDYSAHIVHRFADEFEGSTTDHDGLGVYDALDRTVRGTGGALTGSMLTTTTGIGVLVVAITPILGQFGLVTALAILYSYVTSLVVTPSVVVVWDHLLNDEVAAEEASPAI